MLNRIVNFVLPQYQRLWFKAWIRITLRFYMVLHVVLFHVIAAGMISITNDPSGKWLAVLQTLPSFILAGIIISVLFSMIYLVFWWDSPIMYRLGQKNSPP